MQVDNHLQVPESGACFLAYHLIKSKLWRNKHSIQTIADVVSESILKAKSLSPTEVIETVAVVRNPSASLHLRPIKTPACLTCIPVLYYIISINPVD